jgi:hypothetical protein
MKLTNSCTLSMTLINTDIKSVKNYPMKKFFLLFSMLTCCFSVYSQTISLMATETNVASGRVIEIKASGETSSKYILGITYRGLASVPFSSQISGAISGPAFFYNKTTGAPTSFGFGVTNNSSAPATVTYTFRVTPYDANAANSLPPVDLSVTVVVKQSPPPDTDLGYNMTLTVTGDYKSFTLQNLDIFHYDQDGYQWQYSTTPDFSTYKVVPGTPAIYSMNSHDLLPWDPFHPRPDSDYYLTQTTYFREKITYGGKFSYSNVVAIVK